MEKTHTTTDLFKEGMSKLAGAVSIIATDGPAGKGGITATAICSVTTEPPTLLACVNLDSEANKLIKENQCFSVNLLSQQQEELSNRFAGFIPNISMADRLLEGNWKSLHTNAPLLSDGLVSFDCKLADSKDVGSHTVFFGEVVGVTTTDNTNPLIYFDRGYKGVQKD